MKEYMKRRISKKIQWVKAHAIKPDDLCLIGGTPYDRRRETE
jgi:recombinational DNA repair ATPase RecF